METARMRAPKAYMLGSSPPSAARRKLRGLSVIPHYPLTTAAVYLTVMILCLPVLITRYRNLRVLNGGVDLNAWRSVDRAASPPSREPDIELRQAWVYGDHGNALEKRALLGAARVQELLLRGVAPATATSFVQSLLLGTDLSGPGLDSNDSVLAAINDVMNTRSPANATLYPSSTLATPFVVDSKVVWASAIVLSLFYTSGSASGDAFSRAVNNMSQSLPSWGFYRHSSPTEAARENVAYVLARPATGWDDIAFYVIYATIAAYVLYALSGSVRLKSKVVQVVAIIIQSLISTTVALTVASLLKVDLLTVPLKAYPLISMAQCVANSLQLVDEIDNSSSNSRMKSVSDALGRLGTTPFTAAAQKASLLILLSTTTTHGFASFGYTAAISICVDLFLFFTFTVAVLSLNTRAINLQESFSSAEERGSVERNPYRASSPEGNYKRSSSKRGGSRKAAGLVVAGLSIAFSLAHFLLGSDAPKPGGLPRLSFETAFHALPSYAIQPVSSANPFEWLQSLAVNPLREAPGCSGSNSSRYLVRFHDPLIAVPPQLALSNGSLVDIALPRRLLVSPAHKQMWLPTLAFSIVSLVVLYFWEAGVASEDDGGSSASGEDGGVSSIVCLPQAHTLDVFLLAADSRRFLVSVGFDREIRLWDLESPTASSQPIPYSTSMGVHWPVTLVSIDSKAEWVAICSHDRHVALWNRQRQCFGLSSSTESRIVSCVFAKAPTIGRTAMLVSRLLLMLENGGLVDINIDTGHVIRARLCNNVRIRSAHISSDPRMPARLVILTEHEGIFVSVNRDGRWLTRPLQLAAPDFASPAINRSLRFSVIPSLRGVGIAYNEEQLNLHLLDLSTGAQIYTFHSRPLKFSTLRAFHAPPQSCVYCGSTAVSSFSIAYTEKENDASAGGGGNFIMTTVSAEHNPQPYRTGLICLRSERHERERRCAGLVRGAETTHVMPNPGVWEATGANGVAGVRRRITNPDGFHPSSSTSQSSSSFTSGTGFKLPTAVGGDGKVGGTAIRRIGKSLLTRRGAASSTAVEERWEAWTMTAKGTRSTHQLTTNLLANKSGPVCRLARNAVAVGLADIIVLVQFGDHLYDNDETEGAAAAGATYGKLSRQNSRLGRFGR